MVKYHVYISYELSIKNQIQCLKEKLEERNVKLCETNESYLGEQQISELPHGLKRSKVVIICVTEKYFNSLQCQLEFKYAEMLIKPVIALMIDKTEMKINQIMSSSFTQINCQMNLDDWVNVMFDEILEAIKINLHTLKVQSDVSISIFKLIKI